MKKSGKKLQMAIWNNNTTLKWFQSRINHKNIEHLLWDSQHTQKLLYDFKHWCESNNNTLNLQKQSFLFGILDNKTSIVDQQSLLEIKYYIYFCRSKGHSPEM